MIVLDASVVVDALVAVGSRGDAGRDRLRQVDIVAAPHLLDAEVVSVLRRLLLAGELSLAVAQRSRTSLADLAVERYSFAPFSQRVWELRDRVAAYDAWYVALAELLTVPLVTADERLQRVHGLRCPVLAP